MRSAIAGLMDALPLSTFDSVVRSTPSWAAASPICSPSAGSTSSRKCWNSNGETFKAWGVEKVPEMVLIDPEGKVVRAGNDQMLKEKLDGK